MSRFSVGSEVDIGNVRHPPAMRAIVLEVHNPTGRSTRTTYTVKILRHHPNLVNPESFPIGLTIRVESYLVRTIPALILLAEAAE